MSNTEQTSKLIIETTLDLRKAKKELEGLKKTFQELEKQEIETTYKGKLHLIDQDVAKESLEEIKTAMSKIKGEISKNEDAIKLVPHLDLLRLEEDIKIQQGYQKQAAEDELKIKKNYLNEKKRLLSLYNQEENESAAQQVAAKIELLDAGYQEETERLKMSQEAFKAEIEKLNKEKTALFDGQIKEEVSNYDKAQAAQAEIKAKTDAVEKARKENQMASLLTAEIKTQNEIIRVKKEAGQATEEELKKLDLLEAARRKKRLDDAVSYGEKSVEIAQKTSDFLTEIDGDRIKQEKQKADEKYEEDKQKEEQKLKDGTYTQEQYDAAIENLQKVRDEKKKKLDQRQAILQKSKALFEVGVNTSKSISAANPNIPLMAFAAVSGAIQAATIVRSTYPKTARGGLIGGKPHSLGGTLIEAEAGEAVINKRSTSMFAPLLSAINESGGGVPFAAPLSDGGFAQREYQRRNRAGLNEAQMEEAMARAFSQQQIYVAIEDINKGQKQYAEIKDMSKF